MKKSDVIGRTIIDAGDGWIQIDSGEKLWLDEELEN